MTDNASDQRASEQPASERRHSQPTVCRSATRCWPDRPKKLRPGPTSAGCGRDHPAGRPVATLVSGPATGSQTPGRKLLGTTPRDATDAAMARRGRVLDVTFDVDLGELVPGHHVVARGIDLGRAATVGEHDREPELHCEFVPGIEEAETADSPFFWYWMLSVSDDEGTAVRDNNGGAVAPSVGGAATHAVRDLGGPVPAAATRLELRFEPPDDWVPPEPWRRRLVIDLRRRSALG